MKHKRPEHPQPDFDLIARHARMQRAAYMSRLFHASLSALAGIASRAADTLVRPWRARRPSPAT